MAKTITITIEVYDGTTTDQIESIVGDALDNNGIDCTYDVDETKEQPQNQDLYRKERLWKKDGM